MVAVVLSTYNPPGGERDKYLLKTVDSLTKNLVCAKPCIFRLILADDGSEDQSFLNEAASMASLAWGTTAVISTVNRKGIGGSLNAALQQLDPFEFWMYSTDDWVLERPLNIEPALKLIREEAYDYVRINPLHPNLLAWTRFRVDIGWWLELVQSRGGFAFATRPFIANRQFYTTVGPFDEYLDAYETERLYAVRTSAAQTVKLGALVDMHGSWLHIGEQQVGKLMPRALHAV